MAWVNARHDCAGTRRTGPWPWSVVSRMSTTPAVATSTQLPPVWLLYDDLRQGLFISGLPYVPYERNGLGDRQLSDNLPVVRPSVNQMAGLSRYSITRSGPITARVGPSPRTG